MVDSFPLAYSRIFALAWVLVLAGIQHVTWITWPMSKSTPPISGSPTPLSGVQLQLLGKQYDTAVEEIRQRAAHEGTLYAFKFTLVGAILAFLLANYWKRDAATGIHEIATSPIAAAFFWCAVIVSGLIDTRINFNAAIVQTIGGWIRDHVEARIYGEEFRGWEGYLAYSDVMFRSEWYPLLRLNMNLLTYVLFFATCCMFSVGGAVLTEENKRSKTTSMKIVNRVSFLGAAGAFMVFFLQSLHFNYTEIWCVIVGFAISLFGVWKCFIIWPWNPMPETSSR